MAKAAIARADVGVGAKKAVIVKRPDAAVGAPWGNLKNFRKGLEHQR